MFPPFCKLIAIYHSSFKSEFIGQVVSPKAADYGCLLSKAIFPEGQLCIGFDLEISAVSDPGREDYSHPDNHYADVHVACK